MRFVVAYVVTAIVFLGLDALWLSRIALDLYRRELGALLMEKPNLAVAGVFYLLFVAGLVILAVLPNADTGNWLQAAFYGAVLGLVAYGTYDITNLSTLKGWSVTVTIADLVWGTLLSAGAAAAGTLALSWFRL
jgi:uncharacterized membrane protein